MKVCINLDIDEKTVKILELAGVNVEDIVSKALSNVLVLEHSKAQNTPSRTPLPRPGVERDLDDFWEAVFKEVSHIIVNYPQHVPRHIKQELVSKYKINMRTVENMLTIVRYLNSGYITIYKKTYNSKHTRKKLAIIADRKKKKAYALILSSNNLLYSSIDTGTPRYKLVSDLNMNIGKKGQKYLEEGLAKLKKFFEGQIHMELRKDNGWDVKTVGVVDYDESKRKEAIKRLKEERKLMQEALG